MLFLCYNAWYKESNNREYEGNRKYKNRQNRINNMEKNDIHIKT